METSPSPEAVGKAYAMIDGWRDWPGLNLSCEVPLDAVLILAQHSRALEAQLAAIRKIAERDQYQTGAVARAAVQGILSILSEGANG